ncbi:hypothetical protein BOO69_08980 [Sulfitobacter alexandrii]|uniref:DUF1468 domain-containing protein n=2 Tax=Sulfitobacter alexandrii TaxID=1917485 RepID=A0A1J0WGT7_9RHOB|nr:hypothetical protein BOO69_08980 [Sulfitobacter alexandrii]
MDAAALLTGLAIAAGCAWVAWESWSYGLGSLRRMGPGFFPFFAGIAGAAIGLVIAWRALRAEDDAGQSVPLRRLLFIGAAFVFFALAVQPLGLLVTLFITTLIGAYADAEARLGQTLVLATCLSGGIWLIFVRLLGVSIPAFPSGF